MKGLLSCISFFVISISSAYAQKDFRAGYIITIQNDTIFGEVDYRSNSRNYRFCRFKKDNNTIEYDPQQLLGYGYSNDKYFTSGIVEESFAEVLVQGELSLYKHGSLFFIRKSGGELYKLESKEVRVDVDGKVGVKKDTRWKGITSYLISDCIQDPNTIKALELDEKELTKLAIEYNKCRGTGFIDYKESKPWTKFEVGINLGVTKSTIEVNSSIWSSYLSDRYTSLYPFIGLMFGISSPRITERIALQPEVQFSKSSYSSLIVVNRSSSMEFHDTIIDLTTLSIPMAFRYSLPERKYSMQFLAGINYDYHIKSTATVVNEYVSDGIVYTTENSALKVNQNQFGYWAGLSVIRSFGKFKTSLGIRYFQMSSLSDTEGITTKGNKLSLSLILQMK